MKLPRHFSTGAHVKLLNPANKTWGQKHRREYEGLIKETPIIGLINKKIKIIRIYWTVFQSGSDVRVRTEIYSYAD